MSTTNITSLTSAKIIVSGRRIMQNHENFPTYIQPLADKLGAGVGASRAASIGVAAGHIGQEGRQQHMRWLVEPPPIARRRSGTSPSKSSDGANAATATSHSVVAPRFQTFPGSGLPILISRFTSHRRCCIADIGQPVRQRRRVVATFLTRVLLGYNGNKAGIIR
jgi:hypothetical protein